MDISRRDFIKNGMVAGAALGIGMASLRFPKSRDACIRPPGAIPEDRFLATCIRCGRCADACPNRCIATFTTEHAKQFSIEPGAGDEGTPVIFPRLKGCNLCISQKDVDKGTKACDLCERGIEHEKTDLCKVKRKSKRKSRSEGSVEKKRNDFDPMLLCTDACPTGALLKVRRTAEDIQKSVAMGVAKVDKNLCHSYNKGSCGVCVRACPFENKALRAGFFERPILDEKYCVGCGLCEMACIQFPQAITVIPNVTRAIKA